MILKLSQQAEELTKEALVGRALWGGAKMLGKQIKKRPMLSAGLVGGGAMTAHGFAQGMKAGMPGANNPLKKAKPLDPRWGQQRYR